MTIVIQCKTSLAGPVVWRECEAGDVIEVDDLTGAHLIAVGVARPKPAPKPKTKRGPKAADQEG